MESTEGTPLTGFAQLGVAYGKLQPKSLFVEDLSPKDRVQSVFLVKSKALQQARNGKPYLSLLLGDRTGDIDGRVWEDADAMSSGFEEGDFVAVGGKVTSYQGRHQLVVDHLVSVPGGEVSIEDFVPKSTEDLDQKYEELLQVFRSMENPWIKKLGVALLEDPEIAPRYKVCPAAKTIHHAFLGGLLIHSLQVIQLVDNVVPLYDDLDRDILVFGAAFHDFGKIFELAYQDRFSYTDEGKLVGHITIGVNLIDRKVQQWPDFPKDLENQLKHIVLSHHGRLDYGSPKEPMTIEAIVLHALDDLDSRVNSIQTHLRAQKDKSRWAPLHRAYRQYYYRSDAYLS